MFEEMIAAIQDETVRRLYSVRLRKDEEVKREGGSIQQDSAQQDQRNAKHEFFDILEQEKNTVILFIHTGP